MVYYTNGMWGKYLLQSNETLKNFALRNWKDQESDDPCIFNAQCTSNLCSPLFQIIFEIIFSF